MMIKVSSSCYTAACLLLSLGLSTTSAFTITPKSRPSSTRLFLEDWVAEMIDGELYRQGHKKEFENKWMEKNKHAILHQLNTASDSSNTLLDPEDQAQEFRQHAKDKKLARDDPARYCADRCLATGNCDVYEDFFQYSPQQVLEFCEECVLNDDEDSSCDIPDAFYEGLEP